ncbi:MAG: ribonuclease E activity regulator RraA [Pseudomonadota bacterium]
MTTKTTDLCDACNEALACELPFAGYGLRRAFAGPIRTMRYAQGLQALRDLVNQPGNGHVLVIDGSAAGWRAVLGDVMAERAVLNGWAGIVVNGMIRDCAEINGMDIGVKALGTAPRRASISGPSDVDVPLAFGGITFTPGAWLVADEDGVIVLPAGMTEADINVADVVAATAAYATSVK